MDPVVGIGLGDRRFDIVRRGSGDGVQPRRTVEGYSGNPAVAFIGKGRIGHDAGILLLRSVPAAEACDAPVSGV